MDLSILGRLLPAVLMAVAVVRHVDRSRNVAWGEAFDEVLRVLMVGLVAGRVGWLLLGGPSVWSSALGTAVLVRAGVETGIGVLVAAWWIGWRRRDEHHAWRLTVAVPAALAGQAVWQGLCQVEGVCGGVAVSWGVVLPGRAAAAFPAAYAEATLLLVLALLAWRWRRSRRSLWFLAAAGAMVRVGIGFARPALTGHPTRDQLLFTLVALGAGLLAFRRQSA